MLAAWFRLSCDVRWAYAALRFTHSLALFMKRFASPLADEMSADLEKPAEIPCSKTGVAFGVDTLPRRVGVRSRVYKRSE